jgi:hypothetical protein
MHLPQQGLSENVGICITEAPEKLPSDGIVILATHVNEPALLSYWPETAQSLAFFTASRPAS